MFGKRKEFVVVQIPRGGNTLTTLLAPFYLLSPCLTVDVERFSKLADSAPTAVATRYRILVVGGKKRAGEGSAIVVYGRSQAVADALRSFEFHHSAGFPADGFTRGLREVMKHILSTAKALAVFAYVPYPALPRLRPEMCVDGFAVPSILQNVVPTEVGDVRTHSCGHEAAVAAMDAEYIHIAYSASLVKSVYKGVLRLAELEGGGEK